MKKIIFITAAGCILLANCAAAQKVKSSQVPAAAVKALMQKYPAAKNITWEKEDGNYEANWGGKSGENMSVIFTPAGLFVEELQAIAVTALPAGVTQYVKTHYKGAKIEEAGKLTDAKGKLMYEAEVKGKGLVFDEKGNFLKAD